MSDRHGLMAKTLIIPGLGGSGPGHWQDWWLRNDPNAVLVEQANWRRPCVEAWTERLIDGGQRPSLLLAGRAQPGGAAGHAGRREPARPADRRRAAGRAGRRGGDGGQGRSRPRVRRRCRRLRFRSRRPWSPAATTAACSSAVREALLSPGARSSSTMAMPATSTSPRGSGPGRTGRACCRTSSGGGAGRHRLSTSGPVPARSRAALAHRHEPARRPQPGMLPICGNSVYFVCGCWGFRRYRSRGRADDERQVRPEGHAPPCALARGELALSTEIAEAYSISKKFLDAILRDLRVAGLILTRKGRAGGYRLSRAAEQITVGEVLRVLDGPIAPIQCAYRSGYQPCHDCPDASVCPVRLTMIDVREAIASVHRPSQHRRSDRRGRRARGRSLSGRRGLNGRYLSGRQDFEIGGKPPASVPGTRAQADNRLFQKKNCRGVNISESCPPFRLAQRSFVYNLGRVSRDSRIRMAQRIVGFAGSLSKPSRTRALVEAAVEQGGGALLARERRLRPPRLSRPRWARPRGSRSWTGRPAWRSTPCSRPTRWCLRARSTRAATAGSSSTCSTCSTRCRSSESRCCSARPAAARGMRW